MTETVAQLLRDGITVLFGALAGGVTNRVAIMMLFHPYEPPEVLGRRVEWLQGAVPKNRERLAGTIGRTIGTKLLTPADVAEELQDERLREAFEMQLRLLLSDLLDGDKPALNEILPESALEEVRRILEMLLDGVRDRVIANVESEEFTGEATRMLATVSEAVEGESLAESIGTERIARLREHSDAWLSQVVESDSFATTVRAHLERVAAQLLVPGRSFEELLPEGLVAALEHAIADYLPIAMERLGRLLEDPKARARIERWVHELLERFMQDLAFHQRVVAKLIITEDTVNKVINTLEAEGADRIGNLLREGEVQDAMARSVNEAIVDFLRRPVIEVLGEVEDQRVQDALDSITEWVLDAARDPEVREFVLDRGESAVLRAGDRSWADVVRLVPAHRVGGWLGSVLQSDAGVSLYESLRSGTIDRILGMPLGSLGRYGREGAADRLAKTLVDPVWEWISSKIPEVAANVRVAERVEEKIVAFPLNELEQLIRSVTQRELNLIVRLGYVLGAGIGLILVFVRYLLG